MYKQINENRLEKHYTDFFCSSELHPKYKGWLKLNCKCSEDDYMHKNIFSGKRNHIWFAYYSNHDNSICAKNNLKDEFRIFKALAYNAADKAK